MITPQALGQIDLFADLSEPQLAMVANLAEEVSCRQGSVLFEVGESATQLYILLEGRVAIQVQLTSRPESLSVALLSQPGQLVGWSGLVAPRHYTAAATCLADSRLLAIDGTALMRVLEQDTEMGFRVMQRVAEVISGRLRNIQQVVLKTL